GCWWLWTSTLAGSSDLAFTAELLIGRRCARCSSERFKDTLCRSISARTTIRLYRFHQWQANLRVLEVMEIKTVPYVPLSRAPQRRRSPVGEGPTQGGCWLNLVACERPSRVTG